METSGLENEGSRSPSCTLPERIFKAGEEPTGVRVTPYHKPFGISQILNALEPEEIEQIRASPFGKLVELADKPSFSGRFGRYIISRQLKVGKKHEAWFVFAGKPIRFSLREFALVTGLNCGKLKKRGKRRLANRNITEKPYWGELFGTLKDVPVSSVIRMLKKKTVSGTELRLKYAYLALLSSVILPTTHTPRISQDYAEMIKDVDQFFAYPWGRASFDMLMSSIKERKEVSLSQNTIALKGFVLALQLVMIEAVPALTEVVQDGSSSGSEDEFREDDDNIDEEKAMKKSISPGHARDIDAAGKAMVHSIISSGDRPENDDPELEWSDEEEDAQVDNLLNLIKQGYAFTQSSFIGGVTKLDVERLREVAKAASLNRKKSKTNHVSSSQTQNGFDIDYVAAAVKASVKDDFTRLDAVVSTLHESTISFQTQVISDLSQILSKVEECRQNIPMSSHGFERDCEGFNDRPNRTPATRNAGTQTNLVSPTMGEEGARIDSQPNIPSSSGTIGRVDGEALPGGSSNIDMPNTTINVATTTEPQMGPAALSPVTASTEDMSVKTVEKNGSDSGVEQDMLFPNPTFSLGLTQEERAVVDKVVNACISGGEDAVYVGRGDGIPPESGEVGLGCRKSKRQKNPPKSLLGNYECDKRFLNLGRQAIAQSQNPGGSIDYSAKFSILLDKMKTPFSIVTDRWTLESSELYEMVERSTPLSARVVDVLISHINSLFRSSCPPNQQSTCFFLDTHFVGQMSKIYSQFSNQTRKDSFKFPDILLAGADQKNAFKEAELFYFPFNLDRQYWVGVCIDMSTWSISVLDSNTSIRSDYMMNKEVRPLAQMFPYFARQVGKHIAAKGLKPLAIDRPRWIPQNNALLDSGVSTLLFIQAHASGGNDACKCITADVMDTQVERLAVTLYEENVGLL